MSKNEISAIVVRLIAFKACRFGKKNCILLTFGTISAKLVQSRIYDCLKMKAQHLMKTSVCVTHEKTREKMVKSGNLCWPFEVILAQNAALWRKNKSPILMKTHKFKSRNDFRPLLPKYVGIRGWKCVPVDKIKSWRVKSALRIAIGPFVLKL